MWVHKQEPALTRAEGFLLPLLHLRAHPLLDEDRAQETACTLVYSMGCGISADKAIQANHTSQLILRDKP